MKNLLLIVTFLTSLLAYTQVEENVIHIPDSIFKEVLISNPHINTNGDDEIQLSEAMDFHGTIHYVSSNDTTSYLEDASGIEYFTNIEGVAFYGSNVMDIDLSSNTALTFIAISEAQLTSINLDNNTALEVLNLNHNHLTEIDLSQHYNLTRVALSGNSELQQVNLSNWNNQNIFLVDFRNTPNLTCVQIEPGFVVPYPSYHGSWAYDDYSVFSEDCWQENLSVEQTHTSNLEVQIYPNPAKEKVYLKPLESIRQIKLYDAQGRLLKNLLNKNEIQVQDLVKGNYFLLITLETGEVIHKSLLIE